MVYGSFYEIQRVAIIREESMEVGFLQPACLCIAAVGTYVVEDLLHIVRRAQLSYLHFLKIEDSSVQA